MPTEPPERGQHFHGPLHHGREGPREVERDQQLPVGDPVVAEPRLAERRHGGTFHQFPVAERRVGPRQVAREQRRRHFRQGNQKAEQDDRDGLRQAERRNVLISL